MNATMRRLLTRIMPRSVVSKLRARRGPRGPREISTGVGVGLTFDPGDSNPAYAVGDNELPVQEAFAAYLRAGHVLYDVGANVGFFTVVGARLVGPSGHVVAFEPVPGNADLVRSNSMRNGFTNVTVIEKAVSDTTGPGQLVLSAYSGGAALASAERPPDATVTVAVEQVTIDDFVLSGEMPPPAVVKVDVEGAELEVLRGMEGTLRKHRSVVICEIDDASQKGYDLKHHACVEYVRSLGYDVTPLNESYPGGDWLVGHFVATPPTGPTADQLS